MLGGVKLRQTAKLKPMPDTPNAAETEPVQSAPIASTSNPHKLGNRFSMFEQPGANTNFSLHKPNFIKSKEASEATTLASSTIEEAAPIQDQSASLTLNKIPKPLPPVPPTKPPRPAFNANNLTNKLNSAKEADTQQQPSILVKLRPVQTNANGNSTHTTAITPASTTASTNKDTTNSIFNTINNLNHIGSSFVNNHKNNSLIINENNCPVGVSLISNSSENQKLADSNKSVEKNRDERPDKRASVRELAQMMFEESKVGI